VHSNVTAPQQPQLSHITVSEAPDAPDASVSADPTAAKNSNHFLTLIAMFKNEAHVMQEWLEHYLAQVQHASVQQTHVLS
jgi:cell division septation protein DedD